MEIHNVFYQPAMDVTKRRGAALMSAASDGHDECVHMLIQLGADVNMCDKYGRTPLIKAALNGHERCMHLLL